jgi:carboxylesterase type B
MISPLSQKYFHRAISHSGALNQCWSDPARPGAARNQAIRLANELKCSTINSEIMVNCLRNTPAYNLTLAIANLYYWDYDPIILFSPVVEDFETDEEKFVETREFNENSTNIPWLTGMNTEEGLLKLAVILENSTFYNELIEKFDEILPYTFYYNDIDASKQEEVTKALNKFYFKSETPSNRETQDLLDV